MQQIAPVIRMREAVFASAGAEEEMRFTREAGSLQRRRNSDWLTMAEWVRGLGREKQRRQRRDGVDLRDQTAAGKIRLM